MPLNRLNCCVSTLSSVLIACAWGPTARAAVNDAAVFEQTVKPFLAHNCVLCHNTKLKTANLDLEQYQDGTSALGSPDVWEKVLEKLQSGQMPPKGLPRPRAEDVQSVTQWIQMVLSRPGHEQRPDPGRVTAHRLNRFEYNNTIHDLLNVNARPADDFPADDSGYGFDNIGDVLSISPVLMEKYLASAEKIARLAVPADPPLKPTLERYKSDRAEQVGPVLEVKHKFPVEAQYELRAALAGRRPLAGYQTVELAFSLDGRKPTTLVRVFEREEARIFDLRAHIPAGEHRIRVEVLREEPKAEKIPGEAQKKTDKIQVDSVEVRGPYAQDPPKLTDTYYRIFVCGHPPGHHQPQCARQIVSNLARRAWRRPVTDQEVAALEQFVTMAQKEGDSFEQGVRVALEAILVSPNFVFRVERDPKPDDPTAVHAITPFELATRLSYFLWSSMPDEELFQTAANGSLAQRAVLEAQVKRMLQDARSSRLVENFAGQWLELRNLSSVRPDPDKFPEFDNDLRRAMREETLLFFDSVVHADRSILDFIDAPYTFVNQRLAAFYGIPGVKGDRFQQVKLDGGERSGVLTQASVLTVTSYPNRTSPVRRGKFLLENILNDPPPPPPPDAGALDESQVNLHGTVRQQFEAHRSKPACAVCHVRMDPLGFAFENYDAVGRWRTHEGRFPVDASGALPDGTKFSGARELKAILRTKKDAFARCLTEKMLTYALGRGLERYDRPAVQEICRRMSQNNYRFSSLILGIVESMPFQMRRGDAGSRQQRPAPVQVTQSITRRP